MMLYEKMLRGGGWLHRHKRWLSAAFIASAILALLITPPFTIIPNSWWLTVLSLAIAAVGLSVRVASFRAVSGELPNLVAAKGIYSVVRFPLYLSNVIIIIALSVYLGIMWYLIFVLLVSLIVLERIMLKEEGRLSNMYGDEFRQWCKTTRAVLPVLVEWSDNVSGVSRISALSRQSFFILKIMVGFAVIDLLKNVMINFSFTMSYHWAALLVVAVVVHLLSRMFRPKSC